MKTDNSEILKRENVFKYNGEPVKMTLGTVVLTCLCVLLIIIATFTQLSFTHLVIPSDFMNYLGNGISDTEAKQHFLKYSVL